MLFMDPHCRFMSSSIGFNEDGSLSFDGELVEDPYLKEKIVNILNKKFDEKAPYTTNQKVNWNEEFERDVNAGVISVILRTEKNGNLTYVKIVFTARRDTEDQWKVHISFNAGLKYDCTTNDIEFIVERFREDLLFFSCDLRKLGYEHYTK